MAHAILYKTVGSLVVLAPFLTFLVLGLLGIAGIKLTEVQIRRAAIAPLWISLLSSIFAAVALTGKSAGDIHNIAHLKLMVAPGHEVTLNLGIDSLSIPFTLIISLLSLTVARYSSKYLHRDPGYYKFFLLLLFFSTGMHMVTMGQTLTAVFIGWEMVGLASALLISFYSTKQSAIHNSLRAFLFYRLSDTALLISTVLILQVGYKGFTPIEGWSWETTAGITAPLLVPYLLLLSSMIKSAQFPFISWLPRAMEGPTPSSAIFYGGLSIHLGVYLLLRITAEFEMGQSFYIAIGVVGIVTLVLSSLSSMVQADIKTLISLSISSQVGIMFIEIALGFRALAVFHFIGHSALRTYQLLQAGSLIHEGRFVHPSPAVDGYRARISRLLYCVAFEAALGLNLASPTSIVAHLEKVSQWLSQWEERMMKKLVELCSSLMSLPLASRGPIYKSSMSVDDSGNRTLGV
jgi:NAD(P)H-quinone oxidoreductase subunit 5